MVNCSELAFGFFPYSVWKSSISNRILVSSTAVEPPETLASATFAFMSLSPMSKTPAVSTNANTVAKHISNTENFVNAAKALLCPLRLFLIIPPLKSNFPFAFKIFSTYTYTRVYTEYLCTMILTPLPRPFQPLNNSHPTPSPFLIFPLRPLRPSLLNNWGRGKIVKFLNNFAPSPIV